MCYLLGVSKPPPDGVLGFYVAPVNGVFLLPPLRLLFKLPPVDPFCYAGSPEFISPPADIGPP